MLSHNMRRTHHVDAARIGNDQLGTFAQAALHTRRENGMPVRRVGTDDDDDIGLGDRGEILCARRSAESLAEAIAGGRVANAGAGVDVVILEGGADQFLNNVHFLIGAARR